MPILDLGNALAALAARMEPKDAASVSAERSRQGAGECRNRWGFALGPRRGFEVGGAGSVGSGWSPKGRKRHGARGAHASPRRWRIPKQEIYATALGKALAALAAQMEAKEAASSRTRRKPGRGAGEF